MLNGSVCKFRDFESDWCKDWNIRLQETHVHRKFWEWAIISEILLQRGMLRPGRKGLGFAVGTEPLSSAFAALGAEIDATDLDVGQSTRLWAATNQHAANLDAIYRPNFLDRATFDSRVRFFPADMNDLSTLPDQAYDFLWSSCAMEHLGSIDLALNFVLKSMRLLKVGGVAVHTTEFNVSSQDDTIFEGDNVLLREKDFRQLAGALRAQYCVMDPVDFDCGYDPEDILYDSEPWGQMGHRHIKLKIGNFICTSLVFVCRRLA